MSGIERRVLRSMAEVEHTAWDALVGDDDPFVEHAFLATLEESGSVGPGTGWEPRHLLLVRDGRPMAALPCYRKTHGYGEYIFDFAWADAARRARIRYFPKLVAMVPLTPATGRRLLVHPELPFEPTVQALLDALVELVEEEGASSAHLLFLAEQELAAVRQDARFLPRLSHQYHFHGTGDRDFESLLERFRSPARKQIRKERRIVAESGLRIETRVGDVITAADWQALAEFYFDTCRRKGSMPYLTPRFFELAKIRLGARAVAVLAYDGDLPVAGTLNFEKGRVLYGRYWGARETYDRLHFELCYYRLLDRALEHGMARFEAGAQGEHKIKRGFLPSATFSAHYVVHPGLRDAIAEFLPREAEGVRAAMDELAAETPFKRDDASS